MSNVPFRDSVVYFIVISIAELTVLLMWLTSGGTGVSQHLHSLSVRLMGHLGHHACTDNIRGGDTSCHVLPLDAKPSRKLYQTTNYHDNARS